MSDQIVSPAPAVVPLVATDMLVAADIDKLRKQGGRWWKEWEPLNADFGREVIRRLICMLDAAATREMHLTDTLYRYGAHDETCDLILDEESDECSCGFEGALSEAASAGRAHGK